MAKPRTLIVGATCKNGHYLATEQDIYGKSERRCRTCFRTYQRNLGRKKRGTPLDAPVRAYIKYNPRRPKPTLELIRLVSANPDLAKSLLAIADSWGVRQKDLV